MRSPPLLIRAATVLGGAAAEAVQQALQLDVDPGEVPG